MIIHEVVPNSDEWLRLRLNKPTASGASRLLKSDMSESSAIDGYARELADEMFTGQMNGFHGNASTDHGHLMEPEARAYYAMVHEVDIVQHGFITDGLQRYGASPDGMRVDNNANLELKNLQPKGHADVVKYFNKHGTVKKYMQQCHFQNFVNVTAPYTDLLFYSATDTPVEVRFERDSGWDEAFSIAVTKCLMLRDHYLNELKETKAND